MGRKIEIAFQGSILRLALHRVDRRRLYGTARRIGLDANGNECTSAMLTRDGRNVLGPGSTAGMYLDEQGDVIAREDLARVDEREWETTCDKTEPSGPHELAGPVPAKALLECVAGAVYEVDVAELDSKLAASLSRGDIYHAPNIGFLLANENGVFLISAEPARFDFARRDRSVVIDDDMDDEYDDLGFEAM